MRLGLSLAAFLVVCSVAAQVVPPGPPDIVGVDDLLCIGVWDTKPTGGETLKTVRVDPQGNVSLFYIGTVKVAGLSFEQAESAINTAYRNSGVLNNASASLNRLETGAGAAVKSSPIAAGDRISLRMIELVPDVELDRILPVSPGGKVGLPLIGQIQVAGLSEAAAEQAIVKALADRFTVKNAAVSVLRLGPKQSDEPTVAAPASKMEPDQARAKH